MIGKSLQHKHVMRVLCQLSELQVGSGFVRHWVKVFYPQGNRDMVKNPLLANTVLRCFLQLHVLGRILSHSSLQKLSKSFRWWSVGFIWPQHFLSSLCSFRCPLVNWRQVCPCAFLSRCWSRVLRDFNPLQCNVLPIVFYVTVLPDAYRLLTRSSCAILGWYTTFLMIVLAPDRGWLMAILYVFHFWIIAPAIFTFSPCFFLKDSF